MSNRNEQLKNALTLHARKRMQQRGIPLLVVQLIEQYGQRVHQSNGIQMYLDNKARKTICALLGNNLYAQLEKHMNAYFVESDGYIVTVGHAFKRIKRY